MNAGIRVGDCFVCGRRLWSGAYMYHADLQIISCLGSCDQVVDAHRRAYDRSRRGRWLPRREALAQIRAARHIGGKPC